MPMQDLSVMTGSALYLPSSAKPIPSSGPIEPRWPWPPVMKSFVWTVTGEVGPPLPMTKTLRTLLLTVHCSCQAAAAGERRGAD